MKQTPEGKRILIRSARVSQRHILDIRQALGIAYDDCCSPSTKRAYRAASKAFERMVFAMVVGPKQARPKITREYE